MTPMPYIPSSTDLGYTGAWSSDPTSAAQFGRKGDDTVAHMTTGEMVVPVDVLEAHPEIKQIVGQAIKQLGGNPRQFIVGKHSSINPVTGMPEFGFLSKIVKKVKKVVKKVASNPIVRTLVVAAATAVNPALGAATAAALTKANGGSWGEALGSAAGTYFAPQVGAKLFGSAASIPASGIGPVAPATSGLIGSGGQVFGGTTVGNLLGNNISKFLPTAIANTTLANSVGGFVGQQVGMGIGGAIDPPKLTNQSANDVASFSSDIPQTVLPGSSPTGVALPNSPNSPSTPAAEDTVNKGIGVNPTIPNGVRYLASVKDRDTGSQALVNSTFGNTFGGAFQNNRRASWGGAVSFV